jgi:hypothetical protein
MKFSTSFILFLILFFNANVYSAPKYYVSNNSGVIHSQGLVSNGSITPIGRIIVPMGEISYFSTTGTAVSIASQSDGSTNMVVVNPVTALSSDIYEFDNGGSNNGRLRYTGVTAKMFHVACTISMAPVSANDVFVAGIAKNGAVIPASKVLFQAVNASQARSTALHIMVELETNDYLELYIGNTTDADDVTMLTETLFAMGM